MKVMILFAALLWHNAYFSFNILDLKVLACMISNKKWKDLYNEHFIGFIGLARSQYCYLHGMFKYKKGYK